MSVIKIVFQAKLEMPLGEAEPDFYDPTLGVVPNDGFVVSRNRDGSVVSKFVDLIWNFTSYHSRGYSSLLNFASWCGPAISSHQSQIISEMKWLMFILIWLRDGASLGVGALVNYMKLFRSLARFADRNSLMIRNVLSDVHILERYVGYCSRKGVVDLCSLLSTIISLGEDSVGFPVLSREILQSLRERQKELREEYLQHPPIPTRIYSALLAGLMDELSAFEAVSERCLAVAEMCSLDTLLGRSYPRQHKVAKGKSIPFSKAIMRSDFQELVDRYDLAPYFSHKNFKCDLTRLGRILTDIQFICKLTIHAYSGMRDDEVDTLPFDCIEEFWTGGKVHYLIAGSSTKLADGRVKQAKWVTSPESVRAIRIAQQLGLAIYRTLGELPNGKSSDIDGYPLFVSTTYFSFVSEKPGAAGRKFAVAGLDLCNAPLLLSKIVSTIEDEDICELEQVDIHRAWRSEEAFQKGKQWKLTTHQFRRSLALYASASGLVSLPSLRRQLQHLTEEMSRYYAAGSAFAKLIIGDDKKHFGWEYQNTQPEAQALSFIADVLLSDEKIFGGYGAWIEHRFKQRDEVFVFENREETIQKFKKGLIAYKPTSLGGCTEVGYCDKRAMRSVVGCLECGRAVIKPSKLDRVILAQESMVSRLTHDTMEWKLEMADLKVFRLAKEKMLGKNKQGDM